MVAIRGLTLGIVLGIASTLVAVDEPTTAPAGDATATVAAASRPSPATTRPAEGENQEDPRVADLLARLAKQIDEVKNADVEVKAFAKDELLRLCTNRVFVKETKAQNAEKVTLDAIQRLDKEWQAAEDELPIHAKKLKNACAKEIRAVAKKIPALGEVFVMDNQGANVGQNSLTSDYWQGDEAKWRNSYAQGKGGVEVGKASLDKSTNMILQQISLPIIDTDGSVIGAICVGVKVENLKD